MKEIIKQNLAEIEQKHQVKILFAVESGSRAWGFPSKDSDYDVRFVYVNRPEWYLSIDDKRDVIELPINDMLDINGWDIRKALKLFRKSNPPLLEWQAIHWGIIEKASGKLIGRTGLIHVDPVHEKAEIGYALARAYWSQGFVTEATREIVHYAFVQAGFHRLEARCNASNPGSYRVMEKLGMSFEGVLREQLKIKGQFVDQRMYSILRQDTEWSV